MMKDLNIVMVCDKNYAPQTAVTITSILKNTKASISFYVLTFDFKSKPDFFVKIEEQYNCAINCIYTGDFNYYFSNQKQEDFSNKYISFATYHRLLMFKILPESVEKAIYVDSDMIVLVDVDKIFNLFDSKKYIFAAVKEPDDVYMPNAHGHLYSIDYFEKWQKNHYDAPYFNAGFYITDIKKCKEIGAFEMMLEFLKIYKPKLADQDVLNAIFGQRLDKAVQYLDLNYNLCVDLEWGCYLDGKTYYYNYEEIKSALYNPYIIHFDGANKPWKKQCLYDSIWWEYSSITPYKFTKFRVNYKLKKAINKFFPYGSKRRLYLKKVIRPIRRLFNKNI